MIKPKIVCLCGSTKFKEEFIEANFRETMAGKIVLSVGWFSHADGHVYQPTETEKAALDELHLRKIDICDDVLVIDVPLRDDRGGGLKLPYIGSSTGREIAYAVANGKPIRYLSQEARS
jgi:hypothetical protein